MTNSSWGEILMDILETRSMGMLGLMEVLGLGKETVVGWHFWTFLFDLTIVNSLFKKKEEHLVTFRSGSCRTQIDYFLIRTNHKRLCKDCEVIPSECLGTQHKFLVMDMGIKSFKEKKRRWGVARVKWWNLTNGNVTKLSEKIKSQASWKVFGDADAMWEGMAKCIRRSAEEVLGVSRGGGGRQSGAWWWNEEVKEKV